MNCHFKTYLITLLDPKFYIKDQILVFLLQVMLRLWHVRPEGLLKERQWTHIYKTTSSHLLYPFLSVCFSLTWLIFHLLAFKLWWFSFRNTCIQRFPPMSWIVIQTLKIVKVVIESKMGNSICEKTNKKNKPLISRGKKKKKGF